MKQRTILITGAVFMALAVILGAFGAHALKKVLSPEMLTIYHTGVEYQFYHALGLLIIGLTGFHIQSKYLNWAGLLLTLGIIIFSGSLYLLTLSGIKAFGAITPLGGVSLIVGWIYFAVAFIKNKS